uniref:C-type lectin domain-containing protein n=1 Tax=Serinus canaria TaxID=9135 RepID=A0A8C9NN34_SERCA
MATLRPLLLLLLAWRCRGEDAEVLCAGSACYTLHRDESNWKTAQGRCSENGGNLAPAGSAAEAERLREVLASAGWAGPAWLGLSLARGHCVRPQEPLRGFSWVAGGEPGNFSEWASEPAVTCVSARCVLCVTVSRALRWEERRCEEPADGFLCQYTYGGSCPRLATQHGVPVTYTTPFGARGADFLALPPGSRAVIPDLRLELLCDDGDGAGVRWVRDTPGAWPCELGGGGCAGTCVEESGRPRCSCPEGTVLGPDGRGCRSPCRGRSASTTAWWPAAPSSVAVGSTCGQGTGLWGTGLWGTEIPVDAFPSDWESPSTSPDSLHQPPPCLDTSTSFLRLEHPGFLGSQRLWGGVGINAPWRSSNQVGWPGIPNLAQESIPTWPRNQSQPGLGINPNQAWESIPTLPGNQRHPP